MSELDRVILDQHARVRAWKGEPLEVLEEAKREILAIATPELTEAVIKDYERCHPESETRTSRAQERAIIDAHSIGNRTLRGVQVANGLGQLNMVAPRQGYIGGIVSNDGERIVIGHSLAFGEIKADDPIQAAMGDVFYPAMMWAKAMRAEAYNNRPESAHELTISQYLAKLGLSLGSGTNQYGDIFGATGFMTGGRLQGTWTDAAVEAHVRAESEEAFRLSGLCDQSVFEPEILTDTQEFARDIIERGGSLN